MAQEAQAFDVPDRGVAVKVTWPLLPQGWLQSLSCLISSLQGPVLWTKPGLLLPLMMWNRKLRQTDLLVGIYE
jgi:hypothetical protein